MTQAKIELYTSPTCPHCPSARKVAQEIVDERDDVKLTETSTATKKGQRRAKINNVRSVPTLFVTATGYEDRIGHVGSPSKDGLNKMIDIALGKEDWPEQKGIFSRLLDKLNINIKT